MKAFLSLSNAKCWVLYSSKVFQLIQFSIQVFYTLLRLYQNYILFFFKFNVSLFNLYYSKNKFPVNAKNIFSFSRLSSKNWFHWNIGSKYCYITCLVKQKTAKHFKRFNSFMRLIFQQLCKRHKVFQHNNVSKTSRSNYFPHRVHTTM